MTYQLIHGDCLEIVPTLPPASVDAIITDLPYGTTACKWDTIIPFDELWRIVKHALKPRGAFVTTASQPFTSALVMSNPAMFKYCWYWDKGRGSNFATVNIRPFNSCEDVLIFYENQPTYNPQKTQGKPYTQKQGRIGDAKQTGLYRKDVITKSNGDRFPVSILRFINEHGLHPTQKPVALYEYLIKTYTNEGETVLDLCMGSGTTGVACRNTGRNFIGIEKDPTYFQIAKSRLEKIESSESVSVS